MNVTPIITIKSSLFIVIMHVFLSYAGIHAYIVIT